MKNGNHRREPATEHAIAAIRRRPALADVLPVGWALEGWVTSA